MDIKTVGVIGSGVMGSGIAAQLANAGFTVHLLDIVPKDATDRDMLAKSAIDKMLKTDPAPLMLPSFAKRITAGNLEDHANRLLEDHANRLGQCDWIIEVVLERLDVKHATYKIIQQNAQQHAIISSNTSSIPLEKLIEGFDAHFASRFLITHFFNPPRYLRLLELVTGPKTDKTVIQTIRDICDIRLGKGVVPCHDRPGFIANRIGTFWLTHAINTAIDHKIAIPLADAVMGKPSGIPNTAIFGLLDLIGIDLMPHLAKSLLSNLPTTDAYAKTYRELPLIADMIANGFTGRKGKGGFYKLDDKRNKLVLSDISAPFAIDAYTLADKPKPLSVEAGKKGLRAVLETDDAGGRYAKAVWLHTLAYALSLVPEISDSISDVDEAMRLGYAWDKGPFEMVDALGVDWYKSELTKAGIPIPKLLETVGTGTFYKVTNGILNVLQLDGTYQPIKRATGVLALADIKRISKPIIKKASVSVWNIGDGVLCLEFTGKMNTLDETVFDAIHESIATIEGDTDTYKGLVVYNDGTAFSAGANLGLAMFAVNTALWPQIDALVAGGQDAYKALKYSNFPVVSAPSGLALGGGCEILLHSDAVQAHAETYCGLVEVGVGIIPGWGGCKEMVLRGAKLAGANGPMPAIKVAFETIATAKVAKSAFDAQSIGYFTAQDRITMNRDRLLFDAKARVLELSVGYQPPVSQDIRMAGASGKLALMLAVSDLQKSGKATPYDGVVCEHLATVLSGGTADPTKPVNEDHILELERAAFMQLLKNTGTHKRIETMLDTGKPLRN